MLMVENISRHIRDHNCLDQYVKEFIQSYVLFKFETEAL